MKVIFRILLACASVLLIHITSSAQGREPAPQKLEPIVQTGHSSRITSLAFSPDGRLLASASDDKTVKLWDSRTGKELRTLTGHTDRVNAVSFSPDGSLLASGSSDATIILWNTDSGETVIKMAASDATGLRNSVEAVTFDPDGRILASGGSDASIRLWDVATGKELRRLNGHTGTVSAVAFKPDGKTLASGSIDKTIKLWDVASGREILWDVASGREIRPPTGHTGGVTSIAFDPTGKTLASGSSDGKVKLWDADAGRLLDDLAVPDGDVRSVAFQPFVGDNLACGGAGGIEVWRRKKDDKPFIIAKDDKWEHSLSLNTTKEINSIAFQPGGGLAGGNEEAKIKLWDFNAGKELLSFVTFNQDDWLVITPDGLFDGSPSGWNRILWRFSPGTLNVSPFETLFNELYYPELLTEILSGKQPKPAQVLSQKDRRQPELLLTLPDEQTELGKSVTSRMAKVQIEIESPAGVRDVHLFSNGTLAHVWRGDVPLKDGKGVLETSIPIVAGENKLTAYGFNRDNIKSEDAVIDVEGAESLRRAGTLYILAVGINQYDNAQYNLKYAVADAEVFSTEIKRQQEKLKNYGRVEVIALNDKDATKANILQAFARLAKETQPEDAVMVYLSGHGTAQQQRFYFIPSDIGSQGERAKFSATDLQTILQHSISDLELTEAIEPIYAGHFLLVIDTANSGQVLEAEEKRLGPMNSKGLAQLAYEKGMYILTASQSYQVALESAQLSHGFLAYALIEEGLKSGRADFQPTDGLITLREWLEYAVQRVPQMQAEIQRAPLEKLREHYEPAQSEGNIQRPRVFYRREIEAQPFIIAKVEATTR